MTTIKVQQNNLYFISIISLDNLKKSQQNLNIFHHKSNCKLLQNTVRPIIDLRIVETLDEFQSITTGYGRSSSQKYQTYYDLLINACVRYDRTKKANIAKRGHVYQTTFTPDNDDLSVNSRLKLQLVIHTWV